MAIEISTTYTVKCDRDGCDKTITLTDVKPFEKVTPFWVRVTMPNYERTGPLDPLTKDHHFCGAGCLAQWAATYAAEKASD